MQSAHFAMSAAIRARATATPEIWQTRVYRGQAVAKAARPYLVYMFSSGIKPQNTPNSDAEFLIVIKCVADTAQVSEAGSARIAALFDDLGQSREETLDCDPDWTLIHSNLERYVSMVENVAGGATQICHDGAIFRFLLERIS